MLTKMLHILEYVYWNTLGNIGKSRSSVDLELEMFEVISFKTMTKE